MKSPSAIVLLFVFLVGCTSVKVDPVPAEYRLDRVKIRDNPKVAVKDFLEVLQEGFRRNGIETEVVSSTSRIGVGFEVTYVAYRNWDLAPYLRDATITVLADGRQIGEAVYHLVGGGGLSLMKWQGTRTKILPAIDKLLAEQHQGPGS